MYLHVYDPALQDFRVLRTTDIVAGSKSSGMSLAESDDQGAGTAYVQMVGGATAWLVIRYVTSSGATSVRYAGPANNPGQASIAAAWSNRAALVYGHSFEA